jgi:hypothetical protein
MHPDFELGTPKKGRNVLDFSQIGKKSAKMKPLFGFACMVHLASLLPVQVSCTIKNDNILGGTSTLYTHPGGGQKRSKVESKKMFKK